MSDQMIDKLVQLRLYAWAAAGATASTKAEHQKKLGKARDWPKTFKNLGEKGIAEILEQLEKKRASCEAVLARRFATGPGGSSSSDSSSSSSSSSSSKSSRTKAKGGAKKRARR